jgi:hypothetical protein
MLTVTLTAVDCDANFNKCYSLQRKERLRAKLKDLIYSMNVLRSMLRGVALYSTTSILARYAVCLFPAILFRSIPDNDLGFYRCVVRFPVCVNRI